MASTFTLKSQSYQGRYMYISCTQTPDIATNTSTISWTLTVTGGTSSYYSTGPTTVTINGETVYYKAHTSWSTYTFPAAAGSVSGTTTVNHDDLGNASISVSISTSIYTGILETNSGTWELDSIPRYATIKTAPNFNDEENPTITYSNPAGTSVSSLRACISLDGSKDDVAYRDISMTGTSYTFSLTDTERNTLRSATTGSNSRTVKFYVRTAIGSTYDGSSLSRTFTIKNPNPTINPTIVDTNSTTYSLTGDSSKLVRYYSNVAVTIGATAVKQASLTSQNVTCGSKSLSANGTIYAVESSNFVFTATDNRGNTTTKTITPSFVEYVKLTCNLAKNMPDSTGAMTVKATGNYFNGSFGAVGNTISVYYRYKTYGGTYGSWNSMTVSKSGNTYSATANLTGLDYQTTYVFQTYAVDKLATVYSTEDSVKATPIFDWGENDFNFNVPVTVGGHLIADGLTYNEQEIYVGGDLNTYYPVYVFTSNTIATPQYLYLKKNLGSTSPAWSGNHSTYNSSSIAMGWRYRYNGWDGNGKHIDTLYKHEVYATLISNISGMTGAARGVVLWLRGGGATYNLASNMPISATVYLETTNISEDSSCSVEVAPRTDIGNGGVMFVNRPSPSVDYAASAGNADTVDGQHFHWSGQSGTPTYVWGATASGNNYVYYPANFSVNYANSAGSAPASNIGYIKQTGVTLSSGYATIACPGVTTSSAIVATRVAIENDTSGGYNRYVATVRCETDGYVKIHDNAGINETWTVCVFWTK